MFPNSPPGAFPTNGYFKCMQLLCFELCIKPLTVPTLRGAPGVPKGRFAQIKSMKNTRDLVEPESMFLLQDTFFFFLREKKESEPRVS